MKIETVVITPKMAEELLARNTRNRPLSVARAKKLSDAMARGEWEVNGDTIRISATGVVLDGQHRLHAIVLAQKSVQSIIVRGLPDSVFDTIDTGSARTCGDVLNIRGIKNANIVAAALSLYFAWEKTGNPVHGAPDSHPTHKQAEALLERKPSMLAYASQAASSAWCRKFMTTSISAFCLTAFSEVDKDAATAFFTELEDGGFSYTSSPVMRLRDRLMEAYSNQRENLGRGYKIALVFKAYKMFRKNQTCKYLRVRLEGDAIETDVFVL